MSVSNSMVCHKWAHGQEAKGSNLTTDGKRLVSYGTDIGYNTGRGLVFLSADSMTPTTGKQLTYAWRACNHLDVVHTPMFAYVRRLYDFNEEQAFRMACDALNATLEGYSKARIGRYLADSMQRAYELATKLNGYAVKYGFEPRGFYQIEASKRIAARVYAEQYAAKEQERRAAAERKEAARREQQRELDADMFNRWHCGDPGAHCPASYRVAADGSYYIAVRGDKVVTSGGAECPLEAAKRGIEFWQSRMMYICDTPGCNSVYTGVTVCPTCHEQTRHRGEFYTWHKNGERVQLGAFQLDRIEADGTAYAGCHKFSAAELTRLAEVLCSK